MCVEEKTCPLQYTFECEHYSIGIKNRRQAFNGSNDSYLILSYSEFYLVLVPNIFYGRLRDVYTILNCVRAQKLNYAAMQNGTAPIELWLLT